MSDLEQLQKNVKLYKQLKAEAAEKVKAAIAKSDQNRIDRKAQQSRRT